MMTYKFRIYLHAVQKRKLNDQMNLCRELYNAMLQQIETGSPLR